MFKRVSIIIPVYNVQEYLERCLNSIINQSYENLEVILVDDGSNDNSGEICDSYKKKYKNILVVHKKNEGQSIARSEGLKLSTGEYISFVDADDFLRVDFYKKMITILEQEECDIAVCDYLKFSECQKNIKYLGENKNIEKDILVPEEAIKRILQKNSNITNFLWNKVYRRRVFKNIKFPKFNIFEDLDIMYKLFNDSRKIVYWNEKLYYYFDRENSSSKAIPSKYIINKIKITEERKKFLLENGYDLEKELNEYRFISDCNNFKIVARNQSKEIFFGDIMKNELIFMKNFYKNNKELKLDLKEKALIKLLFWNWKYFYNIISKFKYKEIK